MIPKQPKEKSRVHTYDPLSSKLSLSTMSALEIPFLNNLSITQFLTKPFNVFFSFANTLL